MLFSSLAEYKGNRVEVAFVVRIYLIEGAAKCKHWMLSVTSKEWGLIILLKVELSSLKIHVWLTIRKCSKQIVWIAK